ncbi:MAG: hypothetical protein JNK65_09890, partial [Deltaproteobacteria bacterium]|nr:hypothetical protein [Deltaproteobacteria bacterium]
GFHSLRDKTAFVGLPNTPEIFKCVAQLNASNNVCSEAFTLGNQIVFLKLIERKEADMSQFDAEKENIKKTLLARKQVLQLKEIKEGLIKEASIKTYLGKKSS